MRESLYYNNCFSDVEAMNFQIDELMISNMLNALNTPSVLEKMTNEEVKVILKVVKNHIVEKSKIVLEKQESYLRFSDNSRAR